MSTTKPEPGLVSVIVPTYNVAATLDQCLASIGQTHQQVEVIVVNDGSTMSYRPSRTHTPPATSASLWWTGPTRATALLQPRHCHGSRRVGEHRGAGRLS